MIWFACKQCGKKHGREDDMAGTLVFCECGTGNRVPWSSTTTEPEEVPATAAPTSSPSPSWTDQPREPASWSSRRLPEARAINTGFCFNHEDTPSTHPCAACAIDFCARCVVTLNGATLCGPCKNFRLRVLSRPEQSSGKGVLALVLSLVGGPVAFILTMMSLTLLIQREDFVVSLVLCLLALILPCAALIVGLFALREIDTRPNRGGRSLALTGVTTGLFGALWSVTFVLVLLAKWFQG